VKGEDYMRLRVAVVYTVEANHPTRIANPHGDEQLNRTNTALKEAIEQLGHEALMIPGDFDLLNALRATKPDVIFNNCTGIHDKSSQPQVAGMLELSGIPFTGSGQMAHTLALYKPLTKKVLMFHGVSTPRFIVVEQKGDIDTSGLRFPAIVKPEHEGSSIGITQKSVAHNEHELREAVDYVLDDFRQHALVEEFISGREFTVGIWGGANPRIIPPVEIMFTRDKSFYSTAVKSQDLVETKVPADIEPALLARIEKEVLGAFRVLECRDYSRIDVRVDEEGTPYVIDVNTLPGLEPLYSDYPKACRVMGVEFHEMVDHLLRCALARRKT
jgi:D-alanine-D-alanine ligase